MRFCFRAAILSIVSASLLSSSFAYSQSEPEKITIIGKKYSETSAINAFLQAAINKNMWSNDPFPNLLPTAHGEENGFYKPEYIKRYYSWLYPFLFPGSDLPNYSAISRWEKPIKISLGLPRDLKPNNAPPNRLDEKGRPVTIGPLIIPEYTNDLNADAKRVASDEIRKFIPIISELTDREVTFVEEESSNSTAIASMRIVLTDKYEAWTTKFKTGSKTISGATYFRTGIDKHFDNAIRFTPVFGQYQVEGFYVLNSKNEIEFSVCYIRDDHDFSILRKLIQECLVRSLGLPDVQKELGPSILSLWNAPKIEREKLESVRRDVNKTLGSNEGDAVYFTSPILNLLGSAKRETPEGLAGISPVDSYFIQTLYSDYIKPGMNHAEAFNAIFKR